MSCLWELEFHQSRTLMHAHAGPVLSLAISSHDSPDPQQSITVSGLSFWATDVTPSALTPGDIVLTDAALRQV